MSEWISVKERLPEVPEETIYGGTGRIGCLVVANANKPTVMFMEYEHTTIRKKIVYRWKWRDRISPWEVIHWMPLPDTPNPEVLNRRADHGTD